MAIASTPDKPSKPRQPPKRVQKFDVLRAIGILLVIGRHKFVSHLWYLIGWAGVELFFVLSGFLVGSSLFSKYQKNKNIDFKNFSIRRGIRIVLPFYLLIFATAVYNGLVQHSWEPSRMFADLLFVQNYLPNLWKHTWYLAVDQHFYVLILPIAIVLSLKISRDRSDPLKSVPKILIFLAMASIVMRVAIDFYVPYTDHYLHPTHLRLDGLSLGVLLAYFYTFHTDKFSNFVIQNRTSILICSVAAIVPCFFLDLEESYFMHAVGIASIDLGIVGTIALLIYWEPQLPPSIETITVPTINALSSIGLSSYSIYLWHLPVATWGIDLIHTIVLYEIHFVLEFWIYLVASVLLGMLMEKLIERPSIALRDRLLPRKNKSFSSD